MDPRRISCCIRLVGHITVDAAKKERKCKLALCVLLLALALTVGAPARAIVIDVTYGDQVKGDLKEAFRAVANIYDNLFADQIDGKPIHIAIDVEFAKITGLDVVSGVQAMSISFSDWLKALRADATTKADATALAQLTKLKTAPFGNGTVDVQSANLKALGLVKGIQFPKLDGTITFSSTAPFQYKRNDGKIDPKSFDFVSAAEHAIDEILGFSSKLNAVNDDMPAPNNKDPMEAWDLFRYDQNGNPSWSVDPKTKAFFSIDGTTRLAQFNQQKPNDFNDWFVADCKMPAALVQNAVDCPGLVANISTPEITGLDVLGYDPVPEPSTIALLSASLLGLALPQRPLWHILRGADRQASANDLRLHTLLNRGREACCAWLRREPYARFS